MACNTSTQCDVLFPIAGASSVQSGKPHMLHVKRPAKWTQYRSHRTPAAALFARLLSLITQPCAVHCRLSCRKAASAVVLTIHPQLARAKRRLRVPGSKIAYHRCKTMGPSEANKDVVACLKQLIGRHRQRRGDMGKPLALRHTARLGQAKAIAGPASTLAISRTDRRDRSLPCGAVLVCLDKRDSFCRTPAAKLRQSTLVFLHGLDIRIGPADRGRKPLRHQKTDRLQRTRGAARMQQKRCHRSAIRNHFPHPSPRHKSERPRLRLRTSVSGGRKQWRAHKTSRRCTQKDGARKPPRKQECIRKEHLR